ncbi:MAG: polymer-forming cytoskeletal protein [Blautia sp.]|nr:polymer-forming cytoskeletal protein [Blautia sp.]MCM1201217.1 polymer-forming cytoskeletal protein [Bacteroides fragilis]
MGFFSDLKDDLSQAVNELMPEEELQAALDGEKKAAENAETAQSGGMPTPEDLSDMLDKMEALATEQEAAELMSAPAAEDDDILAELVAEEPEDTAAPDVPAPEEAEEEDDILAELGLEDIDSEDVLPPDVALQLPEEEPEENMAEADTAEASDMPIESDISINEEEEAAGPQQEKEREDEKMEMEMDVQERTASDETAVVTEGMSITGDITSGGSLELIGTVMGNIDILGKLNITGAIQGNSKAAEIYAEGARINGEINSGGSVKIGQSSVVIGNINAMSAVIAGAVKGDIDVHGPVVLDTSAIVMGNIKSKSVQINNGAVIEGMCSQCYADVNPTSFFEEIKKNKERGKK